jgi:hypothetical protein
MFGLYNFLIAKIPFGFISLFQHPKFCEVIDGGEHSSNKETHLNHHLYFF